MSNVFQMPKSSKLPDDTGKQLRALADRCDRGEVDSLVIALAAGDYEFLLPSSLSDSLVLSALLQERCIDRFKV
jgi:hypothetical protein